MGTFNTDMFGIQVYSPDPSGDAGLAINQNFQTISNIFFEIASLLPNSSNLSLANDGDTLGTIPNIYFVDLESSSFGVTLPDASTMTNRELTFCTQHAVFESWFTINGPIQLGSSFTLMGPSSVKLLCDGTNWWVTSHYGN